MKTEQEVLREIDERASYSPDYADTEKEEHLKIEFNRELNNIKSFIKDISAFKHLTRCEKMKKIIGHAESYIDEEDKLR